MNFFNKFQQRMEKLMGPFAEWINQNRGINALTAGFMTIMPVTLGTAVIAILANLPFEAWQNLLTNLGLLHVMQDFISATISLLALPVVISIAYNYTKELGENAIIGAVISTAVFIVLIPIQKPEINGTVTNMISMSHLGGDGIFPAIICGLIMPWIYCKLSSKNLKLKLPNSVPPMIAESLSSTFIAMIIFFGVFVVKYLFTLTIYGDLFTAISQIITKPVLLIGGSPWSLIVLYCFENLCWFFGIHPAPLMNAYLPVLVNVLTANGIAYMSGQPIPNLTYAVVYMVVYIGGSGNTLGLCLATLFAKSEKYKSMRKVVVPANIFNINEPIIFGFPLMLNPIYFIPMVFTSLVSGVVGILLTGILPVKLNPTIGLPWITPIFISSFMQGGIWLFIIFLICLGIHFLMYLPFFLIDDKRAYEEEQNLKLNDNYKEE